MAKKMSYIAQVRTKLTISVFSLAAALTSLGYVTYAWFISQKSQNLELLQVATEEGLPIRLNTFSPMAKKVIRARVFQHGCKCHGNKLRR
jgi:hypothetical protein